MYKTRRPHHTWPVVKAAARKSSGTRVRGPTGPSLFSLSLLPPLRRRSFFCRVGGRYGPNVASFHSARVCAFRRSGVVCLEGQPILPVMLAALPCLFRSASLRGRVAPGARGTGAGSLPCRGGLQRTMGLCWELDCPLSSNDR